MTDYTGIKAGDRVWIGNYRNRQARIGTVTKITLTQVIIDGYRYRRDDGRRIGMAGVWDTQDIQALATPEECAAYDAKHEADRLEYERVNAVELARDRKQQALSGLFCQGAWVSGNEQDGYKLSVDHLTENGVRSLAELMQNFGIRKEAKHD